MKLQAKYYDLIMIMIFDFYSFTSCECILGVGWRVKGHLASVIQSFLSSMASGCCNFFEIDKPLEYLFSGNTGDQIDLLLPLEVHFTRNSIHSISCAGLCPTMVQESTALSANTNF